MTAGPRVSVVMCAWRPRPDWFNEAVASVLDDDCDLELIVVDDGSPEPVEALIAHVQDSRLRVIRVDHGGPALARNAGIRAARGMYIRFADADDVVEPHGTSALLELADEETIAYGATLECDEHLRPLRIRSSKLEAWVGEQCLLYRFDVAHTSLLFPRRVVERTGEFDPTLRLCEDWDFVLRACEFAPVRGTEAVVTRYRRHSGAATTNVAGALRFETAVVDRYFERHPEQAGSRLEREARAKLLMVHAAVCPLLGERRDEQLRLILRALALHPRRTLEEVARLAVR
jgi:glycosyltransferase involved in cell wall biosynthesis